MIGYAAVFPAYAGMIRPCTGLGRLSGCVPRLRGDDPPDSGTFAGRMACSPPTRG